MELAWKLILPPMLLSFVVDQFVLETKALPAKSGMGMRVHFVTNKRLLRVMYLLGMMLEVASIPEALVASWGIAGEAGLLKMVSPNMLGKV